MTEEQILLTVEQAYALLSMENHLLKTHQTGEALLLNDQKEHMEACFRHAQIALKALPGISEESVAKIKEKNDKIRQLTQENLRYLGYIINTNKEVMDAVANRVNEKNRPTMMYAANARAMDMNQHAPPSVALNERL